MVAPRYMAAARRVFVVAHIAADGATVCGLDTSDDTELWMDVEPGPVGQVCSACSGVTVQEALL